MAEIRPIIIAIIVSSLFILALINGGIMLAAQNVPEQSIGDDPSLEDYRIELTNTLDEHTQNIKDSDTSLSNSSVTTTTSSPFFDVLGGLWKTITRAPKTLWNLTSGFIYERLLGSQAFIIVLGAIGAILFLTIIVAVIKFISTGEGG